MSRGDLIAFYSPRTDYPNGAPLQNFTAIGRVADDEPFQVEMSPDFHPWRRRVEFLKTTDADARALVDNLSFVKDKQRCGFPFRRGLFEVSKEDFEVIRQAMGASEPDQ
jgi:hypothetical protein